MSARFAAFTLVAAAILAAPAAGAPAVPAAPAAADTALPAAITRLGASLGVSEAQAVRLKPLVGTYVDQLRASVARIEAAEKPDGVQFLKEYAAARNQFDDGIAAILTAEQRKRWPAVRAETQEALATDVARKQLAPLQPKLRLTAPQMTALEPPMAAAVLGVVEALQKLAGERVGLRDARKTKVAIDKVTKDLERSVSGILTPQQMTGYKSLMSEKLGTD